MNHLILGMPYEERLNDIVMNSDAWFHGKREDSERHRMILNRKSGLLIEVLRDVTKTSFGTAYRTDEIHYLCKKLENIF